MQPKPGETPPTGETPPANPVTPPAPTPTQDPPATPPTGGGDPPKWKNGEVYDPVKADEALTASRQEAARLKREKDALEAKLKADEEAKLSEQERTTKKLQETEQENERLKNERRRLQVQVAVERAARQLEFVSEEAALRFLDQDQVTFSEDGEPQNVPALLEKVLKDHPYLKKAEPTTPTPVTAHPPGGNQAGLTPEQEAAARDSVARSYASAF